jgi:hypothetical protein
LGGADAEQLTADMVDLKGGVVDVELQASSPNRHLDSH